MTARVKSGEERAQETEFQRRRNMTGCTVKHMPGARCSTVALSVLGHDVGSKTEVISRGKVTQVLYVLPPLDALNATLALPVPEMHRRRIAAQDARMPEAMRNVLSPKT